MEQQQQQEVEEEMEEEVNSEEEPVVEEDDKKNAGRTRQEAESEIYDHFRLTDNLVISSKGKSSGTKWCYCLYCETEADTNKAVLESSPQYIFASKDGKKRMGQPLFRPSKVRHTRRDCERHLKKCTHFKKIAPIEVVEAIVGDPISSNKDSIASAAPSPSAASTTSSFGLKSATTRLLSFTGKNPLNNKNSGKKNSAGRQADIRRFGLPLMSTDEIKKTEKYLTEWIVDTVQPFTIVEKGSFCRFVDSIRPSASLNLPGREKVRTVLLATSTEDAQRSMETAIQQQLRAGHRPGLATDGWENVSKTHVEGIMLIAGGKSFPLEAIKAGSDHHGIAVAKGWEDVMHKYADTYTFSYLVSDDAGQCGRARRILALRHPYMIFLACWAHQINLMVGALMKLPVFMVVSKKAIAASNAINASSSKYLPKLRDQSEKLYGKKVSTKIFSIGVTRWNTTQGCFASQLRMQDSCVLFSTQYAESAGFPKALQVWKEKSYWKDLEEAELLIRPFCDASFLMQREANTMAHVMLVLLNLHVHIQTYCGEDNEAATLIFEDIEKRWRNTENPLFFLTFLLHPQYREPALKILSSAYERDGSWVREKNYLSASRLSFAAAFYYRKFELHQAETDEGKRMEEKYLISSIKKWSRQEKSLSDLDFSVYNHGENPVDWYVLHDQDYPEMSRLAVFLLGAPVQSASCERLFKDYTRFHTKERNRLTAQKTHNLTVIKHDMKRRYPNDYKAGSGTFTKNRLVSADKYKRVDQQGTAAEENDDVINLAEDIMDDVEDMAVDASSDIDDDCDGMASGEADKDHQEDAFDMWLRALDAVVPEHDEDCHNELRNELRNLYDAHHAADDEKEEQKEEEEFDDDDEEEEYECRREDLLPLPEENQADYPQENQHYFVGKRYIRTDKYSLRGMLSGAKEGELMKDTDKWLPTIMSAFSSSTSTI